MTFKVKVNESHEYRLMDWSAQTFGNNPVLKLITSDYQSVKKDFIKIEKLEIYSNDILIATYSVFDTISSSASLNSQFFESENEFVDVIEISLIKSNLPDQVSRLNQQVTELDKQVNNIIDVSTMSLNEYKNYILSQISKYAQEDICKGDAITLSDKTEGVFTYKIEDQVNLTSSITIIDKLIESEENISEIRLPYHSSGQNCQFYTPFDIITIYFTLFMRSIKIQTYTNALNILVKNGTTKEEIDKYSYGVNLPEDVQRNVDNIISSSTDIMEKLINNYKKKLIENTSKLENSLNE